MTARANKRDDGHQPGVRRSPSYEGTLVPAQSNTRLIYRTLKRTIDLVVSILVLIASSAFIVIIAALIRLDSGGPAIFKQTRTGKDGVEFTCFKFRTMATTHQPDVHRRYLEHLIENGDSVVASHMDGREITRIGHFLRKTSLDELPQLINVIRGNMSVVGPRPPIPYEVAVYQPWHRRRLEVKPGMTGWWQVKGRGRVTFDEMVHLDIYYIDHRSLWLDLKILAMTPTAAVRGSG